LINPSNLINAKIPSIAAVNQLHAFSPFLVKKEKGAVSSPPLSLRTHSKAKTTEQTKKKKKSFELLLQKIFKKK
jgi:hypothetical protein